MEIPVPTKEEIRSLVREELSNFLPKKNPKIGKWLNSKEAAEYLGLPLPTFRQHQHQIEGVKIGRNWQFTQEDLDVYINANRRHPVAEIRNLIKGDE